MKRKLNDFFDHLSPKELDTIMGDDFIHESISPLALKQLEAKVTGKQNKNKKTTGRRTLTAVAACLAAAVCVGAGIGGYAFSVEAAEYKAATEFFDEYNLSTEGLTRAEVKNVYRDITSQTFSYSSTAEVIKNSVYEGDIEGYAISADSPESVAEFWNNNMDYDSQNGESFELLSGENTGVDSDEFIKYNGESEEWRVTFDAMQTFYDWTNVNGGYILYGRTLYTWQSELLAFVENDGQVRYIKEYDFIQISDACGHIDAVFQNKDGTITVISSALDSDIGKELVSYLGITVIDTEGNVVSSNATEIDWVAIKNVTRVDDGYLLQVSDDSDDNRNVILKVDNDGNYVTCFELNESDSVYKVTDITEVGGNVYISSYVVPEKTADFAFCNTYMPESAKSKLTKSEISISDEEILAKAKENYTAMLLICDPESGKVNEFYSVDGAIGAKIGVTERGEIVWDVKNIGEISVRNYFERYEMSAACSVSRYIISGNGEVSSVENTNKFSRHTNTYYRLYSEEEQLKIFEQKYGMTFEEYKESFKEKYGITYEEYREVAQTSDIIEGVINYIKYTKSQEQN